MQEKQRGEWQVGEISAFTKYRKAVLGWRWADTAQVALEAIGMEEEVRARLMEFARLHPGADAAMVRAALQLRYLALAEFRAIAKA